MSTNKVMHNSDPVLPDQGGTMTAIDPLGTNAPEEELVRLRAYEIYEQRGKEEGHDLQHWLAAESETHSKRRRPVFHL